MRLAPHTNVDETFRNKLPITRQFVNFTFYRATSAWRALEEEEKRVAKEEFVKAYEEFRRELLMHTYSLVGLRPNADFMIWRIGYALEPLQEMTAMLNGTRMARYLEVSQSFLSMTKRSMYIDQDNPEHVEDRLHIVPGKSKFLFVYPFVKTREWYSRPYEQRQEMMDEHIRIGSKYRSVRLHTTYSFGLESKASAFTLRDTPMFTCRQRTLSECIDALG
ncbi:MAG: hypothetical protein AUG51_20125 [Acidobacteria bacterium 13_1_20CM_3_53_8]|nr:MAG: hypothetical protein AUG51_20125 [Acidobacteria bacterium 13_1_20CM_3_53_8]